MPITTVAARRAIRVAIAALVLVAAACGDSREPTDAPAAERRLDLASDAAFRARIDEVRLSNAIDAPARALFEDRESWETFWARATARMQPASAAPAVDFTRHMVAVVALGARPSGGHRVDVDGVFETADGLRIEAIASSPGERCVTTGAFTQPLDAVLVERGTGRVTFRVLDIVRDCR